MVLLAALTFVRFIEMGVPFWLAAAVTLVVMVVLSVLIERIMLRPLVNSTGMFISVFDISAAIIAGVLVLVLSIVFNKTKVGRGLRAVSDDHQAALSVGIPLHFIWGVVWAIAGIVALVAGSLWGQRLGVQFSLSIIALKALPVLILGGLDSILGAIIGGLIIGAGEKLAEVYIGPFVGGGIENFFPYFLAMLVLFIRPQGLFGNVIIDRV